MIASCLLGCPSDRDPPGSDEAASERQTVGVQLLAPNGDDPGLAMAVSLPRDYDAKLALERVTPSIHAAVTACGGAALELKDKARLTLDLEGDRITEVISSEQAGLDCVLGRLRKATLATAMPAPVRLHLAFRHVGHRGL